MKNPAIYTITRTCNSHRYKSGYATFDHVMNELHKMIGECTCYSFDHNKMKVVGDRTMVVELRSGSHVIPINGVIEYETDPKYRSP